MAESIETYAAAQFGVISAKQAALCGFGGAEVDRLCARGEWHRPRRGIYLPGPPPDPAVDPHRAHVVAVAAALLAMGDKGAVAAEVSAAVLWDLPWVHPPDLTTVCLHTADGKDRGYPGLRVRRVQLPPLHVRTAPNGMPVLSPARLIVDYARKLGLRPVLVMADAALRTGLTTKAELGIVGEHCHGWPGAAAAARHLAWADPSAGSVAESLARAIFIELGLTGFQLQRTIRRADGKDARVDIYFPRWRLIFEIDGNVKYEDKGVLIREKRREDGLRDGEYHLVRLTWADLVGDFDALRAKIDEGFQRAEKLLRTTGRI